MGKNQYRRFVLEGIDKPIDPFKNVYAGFLLGSVSFIKEKLKTLGDRIEGDEVAHRQAINRKANKDSIIKAVISRYNKTLQEIKAGKTRPMKEKQVAIYLLRKHTGLTNKEIGNEFGMKFLAVSKTALRMEQLIDRDEGLRRETEGVMSKVEV